MNLEDYSDMIKNTGWLLSSNLISRIFTALFIILLANHLLPADFGLYNFAFSTAFILSVVPEFGFSASIVRETSKHPKKISDMISDVLTLRVLLSLFLLFLLWSSSLVIAESFGTKIHIDILIIAFLTLVFEKLSGAFFAVFRAQGKMRYQSYVVILWKVVYLTLGITGILLDYGLSRIIMLLLIASIFQFILSISFYFSKFKQRISVPNINRWKSLIYLASPFAIFSILSMFYGHIIIILLNFLEGDTSTGIFSAGWKLIIFLGVIPHSFGRALFPFFTKLYSSSTDSLKKACVRSTRNLFQIAVPITLILYLFTPEIIDILFTTDYNNTKNVFRILVWMIPFLFMNGSLRMVLWSTDRTTESSKNLLYSSVFLLFSGFFLIREYGVLGGAGVVISAEIIYFTANHLKVNGQLGNILNKDFLYTSISAAISIFFLLIVQNMGYGIKYGFVLLFIPIYFLTLYKLNAIKKEDLYMLKSLIS